MKAIRALFYRALRFAPNGGRWMSPAEVDEMELWQIGVLLDGDTGLPLLEDMPRPAVPVEPVPFRPPELLEVD